MSKLKIFNEKIYNKCLNLKNKELLSSPNLVSSKKFLNSIKEKPILYLGQETNCWVNNKVDNPTLDEIENSYDNFLIDNGVNNKSAFWQFIKSATGIDYRDLYKNIVWSNTILVGRRYTSGAPEIDKDLFNLSLENLLFLYDYFKPSAVIFANGNSNSYRNITNKFLTEIGSILYDEYPTNENLLLIDEDKNIFWTFHPRGLKYKKGKLQETTEKIYRKLK